MNKASNHDSAVLVAGVGSTGVELVAELSRHSNLACQLIAIDTDRRWLRRNPSLPHIVLGEELFRGLPPGSFEAVQMYAEEHIGQLSKLVQDKEILLVVAGLGGVTGSAVAPVLLRAAAEAGLLAGCVVTRPFSFEPVLVQRRAESALHQVERWANFCVVVDLGAIDCTETSSTVADFFERVAQHVSASVQALVILWTGQTLYRTNWNEFHRLVSERHLHVTVRQFFLDHLEGSATNLTNTLFTACKGALGDRNFNAELLLFVVQVGSKVNFGCLKSFNEAVQEMFPGTPTFVAIYVDNKLHSKFAVTLFAGRQLPLGEYMAEQTSVYEGEANISYMRSRIPDRQAGQVVLAEPIVLEGPAKEYFRDAERFIVGGQDLDIPTFLRKRAVLNG